MSASRLRLAELLATLSMAAEAGTIGSPADLGLKTAVCAVRLGVEIKLSDRDLCDAFYIALLEYIGCVGDSDIAAAVMGDEIGFGAEFKGVDFGDPMVAVNALLGYVRRGKSIGGQIAVVMQTLLAMPKMGGMTRTHCEVADALAEHLDVGERVRRGLTQVFERWNGKGAPKGLKGEAIALPVRVVIVAETAVLAARLGGVDAAKTVLRERAGKAIDPSIAERAGEKAEQLLASLDVPSAWDAALAAEPQPVKWIEGDDIDRAMRAMAAFADLKSRFTRGHSAGVAELASAAAGRLRLSPSDVMDVSRAGLLHDIGRPSTSAAVWDKPGPLTDNEWERVRMHAYIGERVLSRSPSLSTIASVASLAHERIDGSGYHRRLPSAGITLGARVLSAADAYQAMTEERSHRPARSPDEAANELRNDARAGRLDGDAVNAVLASAGHATRARTSRPSGLSDREVEVLRLLALGLTNKEIAGKLGISPKTVGAHLEHLYGKIGVTTRGAASLFAMKNDLVRA
jgi:HD-GYP domain-containing protein (c-di-GMP phosphodiesterase class II)